MRRWSIWWGSSLSLPFLRGDEDVFHGVGDLFGGEHADDAGCAFEGVGSAHEGLDDLGRGASVFEGEEALAEQGALAFGLGAEEIHQGETGEVAAHWQRLLRADRSRTSSRQPTVCPSQSKTDWQ